MSVLVVDKPVGPTSFAVLRRVRRALVRARGGAERAPKLGHGGTLDPMASGVLPVCVGEATKIVPFLLDADKEYLAVVRFGVETDTLDATGQVLCDKPVGNLDAARVEAVLASFRGEIEQVPPMFSALKHHGQPLYRYARAGQTVARPPRRVKVHDSRCWPSSRPIARACAFAARRGRTFARWPRTWGAGWAWGRT